MFLRLFSYIVELVLAEDIQKAFTHSFIDEINTLKHYVWAGTKGMTGSKIDMGLVLTTYTGY